MGPAPASNGRSGPPVLVLAGTSSGVGKTSLSVGIMRALRDKGLTVQAFKTGPDFLDPMHHMAATGRPSINLDTWMLSREQVLGAFHRAVACADVAVVEGVMGLFDGRDGSTEAGSTAQLAKWLGAPVVLVMDASALARSAAAVAKGYTEFDSSLRLAGLLFNKVGGAAHTQWLRDALAAAGSGTAVLGGVPKNDSVMVPERHLGLHMPSDASVRADHVESLAALVAAHVDLDALLELARSAEVPPPPPGSLELPGAPPPGSAGGDAAAAAAGGGPAAAAAPRVRIAVAKDAAFCFYYHDNLALLEAAGAELVPFSPLADPLPADVAGVYLGGGYPERHAAELAANRALRSALAAFARSGGVVYAECGGLIYLSKSIQPGPEELPFPMVGVFPFRAVLGGPDSMRMGYVEVETRPGCPLFPPGRTVRGQVFHFSEIVQESVVGGVGAVLSGKPAAGQAWSTCYTVTPQIPGAAAVEEGYCQQNVLASYVHLHFGNCPDFAAALVQRCRGVDVAGVAAHVLEAVQTAAYLESAVASLRSSPQQVGKGGRAVAHCHSSPDFTRDERLAAKQRAAVAAIAEVHRHQSAEDAFASGRHGSLDGPAQHPNTRLHAVTGMPGRSLSPATTLSKVVSQNSLTSCSPHVGVLPPGETLSPPLTDSPQLSPRELEAQQRELEAQQHAAQQRFFGGTGGAARVPLLPLHQAQQQQYHHQQQSYGAQHQQQYAQPAYYQQQQQQQQHAYPPPNGGLEQAGFAGHRLASSGVPSSGSWPRLHQPQQYPPPGPTYGPASARGSMSAFAMAQPPPTHHQQPYAPQPQQAASYFAANGAASGFYQAASAPPGSRHSRNPSLDHAYSERPGSAGVAPPLLARPPSPLDLQGMERLHSATPYSWQHSHPPSDKIVSLSPGATEMLWTLGLGARVAAVSDACDFPPDAVARAKARRSFAAVPGSASYASLDRHATASHGSSGSSSSGSRRESPVVGAGRSDAAAWAAASCASTAEQLEQVDEEVLARERPGLVVYEEDAAGGEAACSVGTPGGMLCAGSGMGQAVLEALVAVGLQQACRVVCVRRRTLSDVLDSMLVVGEAAGVRDEALRTVDRLRARLRRIAGEAAAASAAVPSHPRVLVLQSLRPLRTVGWWLPDQLTLAGGSCGLEGQPGDPAQELTWEQVQAFAPDVLVVAGMSGGSALKPLTDLCTVASLPGWWLLPAVRSSQVYVADSALFCRAGPRLVEGVESLARMVWGEEALPDASCPERAVLKLSLRPGQRCRPRLLPNHFMPFA